MPISAVACLYNIGQHRPATSSIWIDRVESNHATKGREWGRTDWLSAVCDGIVDGRLMKSDVSSKRILRNDCALRGAAGALCTGAGAAALRGGFGPEPYPPESEEDRCTVRRHQSA